MDTTECPQCAKPIRRRGLNAHIKRMHSPKPAQIPLHECLLCGEMTQAQTVDEAIAIHMPICTKRVQDDVSSTSSIEDIQPETVSEDSSSLHSSDDGINHDSQSELSDFDADEQEPVKVLYEAAECNIASGMCQFSVIPDEVHTLSTQSSEVARSIIDELIDAVCSQFDDSQDMVSVANSNPMLQCGSCNARVEAMECDIVCAKCKSGPVYNNVTIDQQFEVITKLDEAVWDFRPIID